MTNRDPKQECPICHKHIRRLAQHMAQKHPRGPIPSPGAGVEPVDIREPEVR